MSEAGDTITVDCPNCGTDIHVSFVDIAGGRWWSWGLADYADAWEDDDPRREAAAVGVILAALRGEPQRREVTDRQERERTMGAGATHTTSSKEQT